MQVRQNHVCNAQAKIGDSDGTSHQRRRLLSVTLLEWVSERIPADLVPVCVMIAVIQPNANSNNTACHDVLYEPV